MTKQFFRKADGVVLMYDITSEYSFSDVWYWLSCIQVGEVEKPHSVPEVLELAVNPSSAFPQLTSATG